MELFLAINCAVAHLYPLLLADIPDSLSYALSRYTASSPMCRIGPVDSAVCPQRMLGSDNVSIHQHLPGFFHCGPGGLLADSPKQRQSCQTIRSSVSVLHGRWYFEVVLGAGLLSVGWVDSDFHGTDHISTFLPNPSSLRSASMHRMCLDNVSFFSGVGSCEHSWGFDSVRHGVFHDGNAKDYGRSHRWRPKDVIGCAIDLDEQTISFFINGSPFGVAYADFRNQSSGQEFYAAVR